MTGQAVAASGFRRRHESCSKVCIVHAAAPIIARVSARAARMVIARCIAFMVGAFRPSIARGAPVSAPE